MMAHTDLPGDGPGQWANKIVGHEEWPAHKFLANPKNYRIHPRHQQEVVAGALDEIGWIDEVKVNVNTGVVVDGHLRITLALRKGDDTLVPVALVDLTQEEEDLALAVYDLSTQMAVVDKDKLTALAEEIKTKSPAIRDMLEHEIKSARGSNGSGPIDPEIKIGPELFERHDYLVFYFDNEFDWRVACERFDVGPVFGAPVGKKTLVQKGTGRILTGRLLLALTEGMAAEDVEQDDG